MFHSIAFRRISSWVASVAVALTPLLAAPTAVAEEQVNLGDLEKSIVLIESTFTGQIQVPRGIRGLRAGWTETVGVVSTCTGFFVSSVGHIGTAGHCVNRDGARAILLENWLTEVGKPGLIETAQANWVVRGSGEQVDRTIVGYQPDGVVGAVLTTDPYPVEMVDFDFYKYGDNAVLRLSDFGGRTSAIPVAGYAPSIGEHITSIGFPAILRDVEAGTFPHASFKSGTVSSFQTNKFGHREIEVNTDLQSGMSGGPTVNDSGAVVGVNSNGFVRVTGNFNFITHTDSFLTILDAWSVPYPESIPTTTTVPATTTVPTTRTTTTRPTTTTVALPRSTEEVDPRSQGSEQQGLDPSVVVGIGGGIAAVALIGFAAMMWQRSNSSQAAATIRNCRTCGEPNTFKDHFCSNCGLRLD